VHLFPFPDSVQSRIVGIILLRFYIGLHKLRRDQAQPCAPVGSTLETSSAPHRWFPVQSDKLRLQQRTKTLRLVSAVSALPPCPCCPLRELEISAWQYPVQPFLSSCESLPGTQLTIIPDGSIPLGHFEAPPLHQRRTIHTSKQRTTAHNAALHHTFTQTAVARAETQNANAIKNPKAAPVRARNPMS
jgi:hypothetical protein